MGKRDPSPHLRIDCSPKLALLDRARWVAEAVRQLDVGACATCSRSDGAPISRWHYCQERTDLTDETRLRRGGGLKSFSIDNAR